MLLPSGNGKSFSTLLERELQFNVEYDTDDENPQRRNRGNSEFWQTSIEGLVN
jgi:hypothetical protein